MIEMPNLLEYWTADECAESLLLPCDRILFKKLWSFVNEASNPTPLGGDGTDGTVETPGDRLDSENDDKAPHWWNRLDESEQKLLADAIAKDYA